MEVVCSIGFDLHFTLDMAQNAPVKYVKLPLVPFPLNIHRQIHGSSMHTQKTPEITLWLDSTFFLK